MDNKLTRRERIHYNAMYMIVVEIKERGFCRIMKPEGQYIKNEIKRLHNIDTEYSDYVLRDINKNKDI